MEQTQRVAFTAGEIAERLGISVATVRRRIVDGTINVMRLGPKILVPRHELQRLLGECHDDTQQQERA
jgi:excisionase family DNA binding protein